MYLEVLLNKEDKKTYVESLSSTEKQALLQEIKTKKKQAEEDSIRLEAMKSKLEEDEKAEMNKLKEQGISSYEELNSTIDKLESELNEEILNCAKVLSNE